MPVFSLARPFDNRQSLPEMQAMALVNHLGTDLSAWREGRDLEQRKVAKEQQLEEFRAKLTGVAAEAEECGPLIEKAQKAVRLATFARLRLVLPCSWGLSPAWALSPSWALLPRSGC